MIRALTLAVLSLLPSCQREPSFDERYEQAGQNIREKAAAIDAELAANQTAPQEPRSPR